MAGSHDSGVTDRDGADAVARELLVLDRLLYRNTSQHRSTKYFTRVLEVRRACRTLAAPKLPDLLVQALGLIGSVPDSRNGRAREAWVRAAAGGLRRMHAAIVACAYSLESIVQASKHLAHQVSQTYFMALSTVFLACLARLFACNLHLGGRLLEVHGALLRTLLAQPCTSDCLSPAEMAECRVPEETASFLLRLRSAGAVHKMAGARKPHTSGSIGGSSRAASNVASGSRQEQTAGATSSQALASAESVMREEYSRPSPAIPPGKNALGVEAGVDGEGSEGSEGSEDEDGGDTGVHVGRATAEAEREEFAPGAEAAAGSRQGGETGGFGGAATATASRGAGAGRATSAGGAGGGTTGDDRGGKMGGAGKKRVEMPRKKVVLASEFSDSESSSEDAESDIGDTSANATRGASSRDGNGSRGSDRKGRLPQPPPRPSADEAGRAGSAPEQRPPRQPSLFFSSKPRQKTQQQQQQQQQQTTRPRIGSEAVSGGGGGGGGGGDNEATSGGGDQLAAASASDAVATAAGAEQVAPIVATTVSGRGGRVGFVIDKTPTATPRLTPAVDSASAGLKAKANRRGRGGGGRGALKVSPAAAPAAVTAAAVTSDSKVGKAEYGFREGGEPRATSSVPGAKKPAPGGGSDAVSAYSGGSRGAHPDAAAAASAAPAAGKPPPVPHLPPTSGADGRANKRPRGLEDAKVPRRPSSEPTNTGRPAGKGQKPPRPASTRMVVDESVLGGGMPKLGRGGGGGDPGERKRSPSGEERRKDSSGKAKKKKQKRKKKSGGVNASVPDGKMRGGGGGGERNAIDDIFGAFL